MEKKGYIFNPAFLERLNTEFHSTGDIDLYELFDDYYMYLRDNYDNLNEHTSKMDYIYAAVALLKKNKLAIPEGMIEDNLLHKDRAVKPDSKEGLDKEKVIQILNAANDDRFKLYLTFLAASGWRAEEPLVLKWSDFWYVFNDHHQYSSKPDKQPKVFLNGKLSKTNTDRNRYITQEVVNMLRLWRNKRYGKKRTTVQRKMESENTIMARLWNLIGITMCLLQKLHQRLPVYIQNSSIDSAK